MYAACPQAPTDPASVAPPGRPGDAVLMCVLAAANDGGADGRGSTRPSGPPMRRISASCHLFVQQFDAPGTSSRQFIAGHYYL